MRFRSRGVEASLLVADLDASLSKTIKLQMGKEQGLDDQRVEAVLAAGTSLTSCPIGADGSERNVLQYVGEHEDIAFMMYEVSEAPSDYISLTPRKPQALRLNISTNELTHEGTRGLKIEVYLNGALSDVHFVNHKKQVLQATYSADGTRIHRQVEKPWTYQPLTALSPSPLTAEARWSNASASLQEEVRLRGINKWGDRPPAADLLAALADTPLPARLQGKDHMGIIDMLVVSGSGMKDVGSAGYVTRPTRLRDKKYGTDKIVPESDELQNSPQQESVFSVDRRDSTTPFTTSGGPVQDSGALVDMKSSSPLPLKASAAEDPFADTQGETPAKPSLPYAAPDPPSTSPADLLALTQQGKPKLKLNAPKPPPPKLTATEQTAKDFAEKNGIAWRQDAVIESFKDRRGNEKGSRSLTHRILDLQKMTPKNKADVVAKLQQEFPPQQVTPPRLGRPTRGIRLKIGIHAPNYGAAPSASQPKVSSTDEKDSRTNLAVDYGATPGGSLIKRIASYSSPKAGVRADTPFLESSSSVPHTPREKRDATPLVRSSAAPKKFNKPAKLNEQTPEEAIASFQLPEACYGSVISYAEGSAARQMPKTRPGAFEEDEVIVGMRFVLV